MRILIVKLSSLGDVVHALPVVADIRARHPEAVIDWVAEPAFAPLLQRVPGIAQVLDAPLREWAKQGWLRLATLRAMAAFVRGLRAHRYDAVVDLQGLTKSALIAALARGRSYGLANRTEGASHEWPARVLASRAITVEPHIHALDRSRELVAQALDTPTGALPAYGLEARAVAAAKGRKRCVVLVHGSSRADKLWPEDRWMEIGRRLVAQGHRVALPQASAEEGARAHRLCSAIAGACEVWPAMDLGALLDRLAGEAEGLIGVDSGPSHIGVALGLPLVQIYNFPTSWRTGPQARHGGGRQVSVEGEPAPSVEAVWAAWLGVQRAAAA